MPENENEEIIHFWDQVARDTAECGVDVTNMPYTFGSPERSEVTCPACIAKLPAPKVYRYDATYIIVDRFGQILWRGTCQLVQDKPRPENEIEAAAFDALKTSQIIRGSCPPEAPAGRVIVMAVFPA